MSCSFAAALLHEMTGKVWVFFQYIILDLFAQITYHKNKLRDAGFYQLINYYTEYGFSRQRY
jgi:hypothetical protein